MALKYGKHAELRPSTDIPALFEIEELVYVYTYKDRVKDVHGFMKKLYNNRRRIWKFERDRHFIAFKIYIKRYSYVNTHLVNRLVEWQYIDNDGFWLKDEVPNIEDAIFICLAVRDYVNNHRKANK